MECLRHHVGDEPLGRHRRDRQARAVDRDAFADVQVRERRPRHDLDPPGCAPADGPEAFDDPAEHSDISSISAYTVSGHHEIRAGASRTATSVSKGDAARLATPVPPTAPGASDAADDPRRQHRHHLVDEPRVEGRPEHAGAALDEHADDVATRRAAPSARRGRRRPGLPSTTSTCTPAARRRATRSCVRELGGRHEHRSVARVQSTRHSSGSAQRAVDDHAERRASALESRRQRGVILQDRVDSDEHGVVAMTEAMGDGAARLGGDPLRLAARRRDPAIERCGEFGRDKRQSRGDVLHVELVEALRLRRRGRRPRR